MLGPRHTSNSFGAAVSLHPESLGSRASGQVAKACKGEKSLIQSIVYYELAGVPTMKMKGMQNGFKMSSYINEFLNYLERIWPPNCFA